MLGTSLVLVSNLLGILCPRFLSVEQVFPSQNCSSRAILPSGMISFTAKRITSKSSMSITSTTTKKTISASGVWRNS